MMIQQLQQLRLLRPLRLLAALDALEHLVRAVHHRVDRLLVQLAAVLGEGVAARFEHRDQHREHHRDVRYLGVGAALREPRHELLQRVRVAVPTEDAGSITPRPEAQERGAGSPTPRARRNSSP